MDNVMLSFDKVSAHYGKIQALHEVSLHINQGEIVTLIGANGAGKTTLLGTLCGDPRATSGRVVFDGKDITDWQTAKIMREAVAIVPEGRRVFSRMTVEENLAMGGFFAHRDQYQTRIKWVYELFPRLHERLFGKKLRATLLRGEVAVKRSVAIREPRRVDSIALGANRPLRFREVSSCRCEVSHLETILIEPFVEVILTTPIRKQSLVETALTVEVERRDREKLLPVPVRDVHGIPSCGRVVHRLRIQRPYTRGVAGGVVEFPCELAAE